MQYQQQREESASESASASASRRWGYYNYMNMNRAGAGAGAVAMPMAMIEPLERVGRVASESAVVIFSVSSCCMCHAVKRLFCGMGVHPRVYELDQDPRGKDIERALIRLLLAATTSSTSASLPVVFVGGKLVGAMDRVMASHINGTLVPLLKQAGALWL